MDDIYKTKPMTHIKLKSTPEGLVCDVDGRTIPVAKEEEGLFLELSKAEYKIKLGPCNMIHKNWEVDLKEGIMLPPGCLDIRREYCKETHPELKEFAYLKKDEESQEDLWNEAFKIIYDPRIKYTKTEELLKSKFKISRI